MRIALMCGISALAITTAAFAVNSTVSTVGEADSFTTGSAPASVTKKSAAEKQSAVVGSNYAVITGAIDGLGQLNSYIRLFNGGAASTNFSITIVNSATGQTVGTTATVQVPPLASKQMILHDILVLVAPGTAAGGTYALYIQAPEATAGYQHVVFNGASDLFENASLCKTLLNQVVAPVSNSIVMINVHTSLIEDFGYPMRLEFHNFADTAKTYVAKVYDAYSGTLKGQINISAQANTSYTIPFVTNVQKAASVNWTPSAAANEFWANVVITDSSGAAPNATVGAVIDTSRKLGTLASSNMSMACAVNAVTTSTGGGGFGGGDVTY